MSCTLIIDEKHVQKVKKEIDNLASVWRKRKRQCIEVSGNHDDCI